MSAAGRPASPNSASAGAPPSSAARATTFRSPRSSSARRTSATSPRPPRDRVDQQPGLGTLAQLAADQPAQQRLLLVRSPRRTDAASRSRRRPCDPGPDCAPISASAASTPADGQRRLGGRIGQIDAAPPSRRRSAAAAAHRRGRRHRPRPRRRRRRADRAAPPPAARPWRAASSSRRRRSTSSPVRETSRVIVPAMTARLSPSLTAGPTVVAAAHCRPAAATFAQQQRLGQADPGELAQVQALVRAVRPRVRVFDAGHQDRRLREHLLERGDERDRAADTDVHRRRCRPTRSRNAARAAS